MIKTKIDKTQNDCRIVLDGPYIDTMAELIALVYLVCAKLAEENNLNKNKLIKDVLEVAMEDLGEI